MHVVDRISATDRAVSAYRRFVECPTLDCVPDMISDLLHWFRVMLDGDVELGTLRGMLDTALEQYERELADFETGRDPLTGNRRDSNPYVTQEWPTFTEERYDDAADVIEHAPVYQPTPPQPIVNPGHPGWRANACNCLECADGRARTWGGDENQTGEAGQPF